MAATGRQTHAKKRLSRGKWTGFSLGCLIGAVLPFVLLRARLAHAK